MHFEQIVSKGQHLLNRRGPVCIAGVIDVCPVFLVEAYVPGSLSIYVYCDYHWGLDVRSAFAMLQHTQD